MPLVKPPAGTHGKRSTPRLIAKVVMPLMTRLHRRAGDTFSGMQLAYLSTVGAKSGQTRRHTVARFDDGNGGWFVVASVRGATEHPAWYHNIAAHPDEVTAEVNRTVHAVSVEQLAGADRDNAWRQIVTAQKRFDGYARATDRAIPVLRLTPIATADIER